MLKIQEYLRSGKTFDDLHNELGINVNLHESLPLVILNYDQIESPKTHPVVRECRALVLRTDSFELVARSFPRFFNWGEVQDEMPLFNWNKIETTEKVDGSLALFYYFDKQWRVNTRGSYADGPMFGNEWQAKYHNLPKIFTWQEGILRALGIKDLKHLSGVLDPSVTYVCEFVSPWNKVVRDYQPGVYLLTRYAGEEELGPTSMGVFKEVPKFPLNSADDIVKYVNSHPESTFEGCVVKDDGNRRWKFKSAKYLSFHRMKGANGDALYNPKNLVPFILDGEDGELLAIYPEVVDCFNEVKNRVNNAYTVLEQLWNENKNKENQKEFALSIVGKSPLSGILFNTRKKKCSLKEEWRSSKDYILKTLFDK